MLGVGSKLPVVVTEHHILRVVNSEIIYTDDGRWYNQTWTTPCCQYLDKMNGFFGHKTLDSCRCVVVQGDHNLVWLLKNIQNSGSWKKAIGTVLYVPPIPSRTDQNWLADWADD